MGIVRLLPDQLVNQIAAGEVVERPASVVKELLENALDAGATRVRVELEQGGRQRILVEDDGCGMEPEDLEAALQRHATSKLRNAQDLAAIATLGFRGEALPSIASVSRMALSSRPVSAPEGAVVRVEGGKRSALEPLGMAPGTRAEVEDLFFNLPARRKFLRSPATELTHILSFLEHYALSRPELALTLVHEGQELLNLAPAKDRRERFFALFPELPESDFFTVAYQQETTSVVGLAGVPSRNLASARYQFTLVNGRFVRDRLLQHAVTQAYENTHPRGRYPVVLVDVLLHPGAVDVNVHPTKREVRFHDSQSVHRAVFHGLRRALFPGETPARDVEIAPPAWSAPAPWNASQRTAESAGLFVVPPAAAPLPGDLGLRGGVEAQVQPQGALPPAPLRALAQWRNSFILCDGPEGLSVVDQHVVHERIRYEEFRRYLDLPGPRQPFLHPQVYSLPRTVAHRAEEFAELLTAQSFEAEPFGEGKVAVRSAPAFLTLREVDRLLAEFFESAGEVLKTPKERWHEVLVMRSCRGAVMLNDPLPLEKLQFLLDTLFSLGAPLTCPHGRPIVYTLRDGELLAKFDRK